ncbi:hypothetical protein Glove_335g28 [Diversispora epigaea]|uniref:MCM C-terminal AAA(+) ATPase domain-containing protein n=1 Tax=Diversispora epigaea TaxID=1348612 RepID=A0A397HN32_9GLOM|nr:hypothetical protein Glove_335g28 [Diversispora epigaea]
MEQQTVSVAKARIITTLNAQASKYNKLLKNNVSVNTNKSEKYKVKIIEDYLKKQSEIGQIGYELLQDLVAAKKDMRREL